MRAPNIFISQPMNGKSRNEILNERDHIVESIRREMGDCYLLDSVFDDFEVSRETNKSISYLAMAIDVLARADIIIMAPGWEDARGCRIEHQVAEEYGIKILYWEED